MTRRRLPPLKALPAFEEAAGLSSFSAAAERMHLTHGAISRQMKSLELYLGLRLFHRTGRRVELTETGRVLLPAVKTALDVIETSASRLMAATHQGPLMVSCLPTFMMRWLIPRLYAFHAHHPGIDVRLSASSEPVDFGRDGIDLAIRLGGAPRSEGVATVDFMEEEIGPICSPALAQERSVRAAADLRRAPLLHTETRADAWSDWAVRSGTTGIDAHRGQSFQHFYFLLEAAVAGLGVAVAPRPLVESDIRSGRLVAPFGFLPSGRRYQLFYPAEMGELRKITIFREWVIAAGKGDGPGRPTGRAPSASSSAGPRRSRRGRA